MVIWRLITSYKWMFYVRQGERSGVWSLVTKCNSFQKDDMFQFLLQLLLLLETTACFILLHWGMFSLVLMLMVIVTFTLSIVFFFLKENLTVSHFCFTRPACSLIFMLFYRGTLADHWCAEGTDAGFRLESFLGVTAVDESINPEYIRMLIVLCTGTG